jgi:hypothetical protein
MPTLLTLSKAAATKPLDENHLIETAAMIILDHYRRFRDTSTMRTS